MNDKIKTPDEYRAQAKQWRRDEQESWDRCDTDGFLSQWAYTRLAQRDNANADTVERGYAYADVLLSLEDGTVVSDETIQGQYGTSWLVNDEHVAKHGRFIHLSLAQNPVREAAHYAKKGVRRVMLRVTDLIVDRHGDVIANPQALAEGRYEVEEFEA